MKLSGWGRCPVLDADVLAPRSAAELIGILSTNQSVIARGNGRAYGDSAINPSATIDMRRFNRLLAFDPATGQLAAEAGVILADIIATFLPRGWFPSVTPGTKYVTLGGMIAADVHGKNHHKDGGFRNYVDWIDVMGIDGAVRRCSRGHESELFDHTLGGMGLTGIILRAAFRLRPVESGWIRQKTSVAPNLAAAMEIFDQDHDATYSVAWIDCMAQGRNLGRSLVMSGEHAMSSDLAPDRREQPFDIPAKRRFTIPVDFPSIALNRLTVEAFNTLYYRAGAGRPEEQIVDWDSYFYPLDSILGWNRIYGRRGFAQFQCVLPLDPSLPALTEMLDTIAKAGAGSFLAVLKRLGSQDSPFSFPMQGYTLALDFPISTANLALLDHLDEITIAHGGRFYLAKDSRMKAATLRAADPRANTFRHMRDDRGWSNHFGSSQSERLSI